MTKVKSLTPFHEEYLADTVAQIRDLYFFGIDEDKIQHDCYKGDNERILYEEKAVTEGHTWDLCLKYLTDKNPNIFDDRNDIPAYLMGFLPWSDWQMVKFTEYPECWEFVICTKRIQLVKLHSKKKFIIVIKKEPISKLTITKTGYARQREGKFCWYVSPKRTPRVPISRALDYKNNQVNSRLPNLLYSLHPNNEWVRAVSTTSLFYPGPNESSKNMSGPVFRTFTSYRQFWEHQIRNKYIPNISIKTMLNLKADLTKEEILVFINREDIQKILVEDPFGTYNFFSLYKQALHANSESPHINAVHDCVRMARVLREPIKLKIKSWAKMVEWHEKLRKRYLLRDLEDIQVDPVYPTLTADCSYVIEKIETKERLAKEAIELHHCVNSYTDRINSGDCAIYSILDGKQRYTAEVVHENQQFKLNQLRGNCNSAPPTELEEFFTKLLDQVSKEMKAKKNK